MDLYTGTLVVLRYHIFSGHPPLGVNHVHCLGSYEYKLYTFSHVFRMYSKLLSTDLRIPAYPGINEDQFFSDKNFFCGCFMYKLVYYNLYYMSKFIQNCM
jgi:hypothetical protein